MVITLQISDITDEELKVYCGIYTDDDSVTLEMAKAAAIGYIEHRTGLTRDEIDILPEFTSVYMVLVQSVFTNRDYVMAQKIEVKPNPFVESILNMHSKNYV